MVVWSHDLLSGPQLTNQNVHTLASQMSPDVPTINVRQNYVKQFQLREKIETWNWRDTTKFSIFYCRTKNTWKRTYICRWWYRRNLCHGCGSADSISLCLPHFQHCLLGCFSPLRPKIYQNGHSGGVWRSNKFKPHPSLRCMLLGSIFVIQSQWVSFFALEKTGWSNNIFSYFSFWIPISFSNLILNCSNVSDLRNLHEQVKKSVLFLKFHCLNKFFKWSQKVFLAVGQNNFRNKIPFQLPSKFAFSLEFKRILKCRIHRPK